MSENSPKHIDNSSPFEELFHWILLEGVGVLFLLIAFAFILASSVKLIRGNRIPGAKCIFASVFLGLPSSIANIALDYIGIETDLYVEAILNIIHAALFLVGAYGFWRLTKYATHRNANPSLSSDAPVS